MHIGTARYRSPITRGLLAILLAITLLTITGCGDDAITDPAPASGSTPNNTGKDGSQPQPSPSGPGPVPHTISISYPVTDSIENLGGGFYRRIGTAIVTDQDGNAVADGTVIRFNLLDSIIAQGSIDEGDSLTNNTLNDAEPLDGGATISLFTNTYVDRNSAVRYIQPGDQVFLINADEEDKDRIVTPNGISGLSLNLSSNYSRTYPNPDYPAGTTQYIIGASLLGAEISGEDPDGNLTTGVASTINGIATFRVTYPANVDTIGTGCGISDIDTRALPTGSARVVIVASVGRAVTTIEPRFCFTRIADGSLTPVPDSITSDDSIVVTYRDGGDTMKVPFSPILATVNDTNGSNIFLVNESAGPDDDILVKSLTVLTSEFGTAKFKIQIETPPSSGSATIKFNAGTDATTSISVNASGTAPPAP